MNSNASNNKNFLTIFQNIDGNKTNFDSFADNEHQFKQNFS